MFERKIDRKYQNEGIMFCVERSERVLRELPELISSRSYSHGLHADMELGWNQANGRDVVKHANRFKTSVNSNKSVKHLTNNLLMASWVSYTASVHHKIAANSTKRVDRGNMHLESHRTVRGGVLGLQHCQIIYCITGNRVSRCYLRNQEHPILAVMVR